MKTSRHKNAGASLVEILLSLGVITILMVSLSKIMLRAYDHYWTSLGTIDVQRATLNLNRRLSDELALSNIRTVLKADDHIIFATPLDDQDRVRYNNDGNLLWYSQVCYYRAEVEDRPVVIRKRVDLLSPGTSPPTPEQVGNDLGFYEDEPGGEVLAKDIVVFDCSTDDAASRTGTDVVNIVMTGSLALRGEFEMPLRNRVFPRN